MREILEREPPSGGGGGADEAVRRVMEGDVEGVLEELRKGGERGEGGSKGGSPAPPGPAPPGQGSPLRAEMTPKRLETKAQRFRERLNAVRGSGAGALEEVLLIGREFGGLEEGEAGEEGGTTDFGVLMGGGESREEGTEGKEGGGGGGGSSISSSSTNKSGQAAVANYFAAISRTVGNADSSLTVPGKIASGRALPPKKKAFEERLSWGGRAEGRGRGVEKVFGHSPPSGRGGGGLGGGKKKGRQKGGGRWSEREEFLDARRVQTTN